ncbi:MAG: hypothetical protein OHK0029_22960 [Armatimonadaceae bacterium]
MNPKRNAEKDTYPISRRQLLGAAAGTVLAAYPLSGGNAVEARTTQETRFQFALLGDIHFDRLSHHSMEWLKEEKPNDIRQVENYSRITREVLPDLLGEVREQVVSHRDTAFVAHIGDFVEGLAGTPELAQLHCREAVTYFTDARLGKPFLFCKGNHDVTGPGSVEAFNDHLMPYIERESNSDLDPANGANYVTRQGNSLFVWFDSYHPGSLDWLEKTLKGRTEQHLFFMIHPPVAPYGARSNWHIFAKPNQADERKRLLTLLGHHKAIVLCGHLHKYGTIARHTPEGNFVQVATLSVIPEAKMQPKDELHGVKEYGPDLVRLEPKFSPDNIAERRELLVAEAPHIRYYDYADMTGYGMVTVNGKQVVLELYSGLGKNRVRRIVLSDLLTA